MAEPLPAYLAKGDDPVLRSEAVRALVAELVGDEDPGLVVEEHEVHSDDADTRAIADAAATPPFLSGRRVVVVRDVQSYGPDALTPLLAYLGDPLPTTSLVLVAGDRGRIAAPLLKAVKAVGHVVETGVPTGKKGRAGWLSSHLDGAPVRLAPATLTLLESHLGEDLGRLSNLLEALAAAYGSGARISPDDVEPFLGEAGSVPPWALTDAIDRSDTALALSTLSRLVAAGERHPLVVLATLHSHYARMLRLDGAGIGDEAGAGATLGTAPFPARKALDGARRLGHEGVAEAISLLAQADLDLRGAKGWPERLVLEVLVARLSRLGRPAVPSRRPS